MTHLRMTIASLAMICFTLSSIAQTISGQDDDDKYATEMLKPSTEAPAFNLKTMDGKDFRSDQFKRRYVVIDFWASWCRTVEKTRPMWCRCTTSFTNVA